MREKERWNTEIHYPYCDFDSINFVYPGMWLLIVWNMYASTLSSRKFSNANVCIRPKIVSKFCWLSWIGRTIVSSHRTHSEQPIIVSEILLWTSMVSWSKPWQIGLPAVSNKAVSDPWNGPNRLTERVRANLRLSKMFGCMACQFFPNSICPFGVMRIRWQSNPFWICSFSGPPYWLKLICEGSTTSICCAWGGGLEWSSTASFTASFTGSFTGPFTGSFIGSFTGSFTWSFQMLGAGGGGRGNVLKSVMELGLGVESNDESLNKCKNIKSVIATKQYTFAFAGRREEIWRCWGLLMLDECEKGVESKQRKEF